MTARKKTFVAMAGGALWLLLLGFVLFAAYVNREPGQTALNADGIVVLTGGPVRIAEAARLLQDHRANRLLISGVNQQTGREAIQHLTKLSSETFECCVDLDYAAQDTIGNAEQTRRWVALHHYNRIIVVTSRFHMPRSLAELERVLPGVELIPQAVATPADRAQPWWLNASTARVIMSEYVKFIPAAARLVVARALGPWDRSAVADDGAHPALAKTSGL